MDSENRRNFYHARQRLRLSLWMRIRHQLWTPKRIKITSGGQDYFLKTVEQNTYELTPELKQAINQTSGRLIFKVDERVNFEIQEEAIPGLKNLFTMQPIANSAPPATPSAPSNPSTPANSSTPANPPAVNPKPASAPANAPLF